MTLFLTILLKHYINQQKETQLCKHVGWVSDSVTQHLPPQCIGLRLSPNPSYMMIYLFIENPDTCDS
jgi:hypothetical protein